MIHGAAALSEIEHGSQRAGNVSLCPLHGFIQRKPFRKIGRDSAGERAPGTVGVRVVDPLSVKPSSAALSVEKIIGVIDLMSALDQHGAAVSQR